MTSETCPLCSASIEHDATTCTTCGARRGYRDGKGNVRGKPAWIALTVVTAAFAAACLWLAYNIPLWYYFYPLAAFGGLFALGVVILLFALIRGPKWYPSS